MAKKRKYYVVWNGVTPGVYDNWSECQVQIKGYPGASYKSFSSREAAEDAYIGGSGEHIKVNRSKKSPSTPTILFEEEIVQDSICVDAACSGNPGVMEYRGVDTKTHTELFHLGPFKYGTNNVGEFLAIVHGLASCNRNEQFKMTIYSDSRTAMKWVKDKWANTSLKKSNKSPELKMLISRAETWLKKNSYENPILKWDTKRWGEIPADFGRK